MKSSVWSAGAADNAKLVVDKWGTIFDEMQQGSSDQASQGARR